MQQSPFFKSCFPGAAVIGRPALEIALGPLIDARESLRLTLEELTARVHEEVLNDPVCQWLMTVPPSQYRLGGVQGSASRIYRLRAARVTRP